MEVLGIDIGGTGIKGAPVDTTSGELLEERFRLLTPQPATPEAVADTVGQIVTHFGWQGKGPVGCGFPAVIRQGRAHTAANVSDQWIGADARGLFAASTGCSVNVLNDADVAGLAEMRFGAGVDCAGVVLIITLGTGIGSSLFINGVLVPNTELGHIEIGGKEAEQWASAAVREREDLSWKKWGRRVDKFLHAMQAYLWPERIIIGGGVSKKQEKFFLYFTVDTQVVPAQLRNEAGIVGAALAAAEGIQA
jgi:polyphosphate glucokinase